MNAANVWFESLDEMRRRAGQALDRIALGPQESEFDLVLSTPAARLRAYRGASAGSPVLFIVPAPIKRPYIWDISPDRSVVRRALAEGFDVHVVEWAEIDDDENRFGLEAYACDALDDCIESIRTRTGQEGVFLAGHSLGGTFAGLYAARRPQRIRALVLIEAPMHFAAASGAFAPLLQARERAKAMFEPSGRIPGSLLGFVSACASPRTFQFERCADFLASLASRTDFETHCRVERWTLDELPLSRRLFEDVVDALYRDDRFMRGELILRGRRVAPRDVTSPLAAVYDPASRIIPPASMLEFCEHAGSTEQLLLPYLGDTGVALKHVGALVGERAHREIWPRIFDWMKGLTTS